MRRMKINWSRLIFVLFGVAILYLVYNIPSEDELVQSQNLKEEYGVQGAAITPISSPIITQVISQAADRPEKLDPWDPFFASLQGRLSYNKQIALDRELNAFYQKNTGRENTAEEEEKGFAFLDDWAKRRLGIENANRGAAFNREKCPFENTQQYTNALMYFEEKGYEHFASDQYKAWVSVRNADRATKMKVAGIDPYVRVLGLVKKRNKTIEEIDKELDEYNAKILRENYLATHHAFDATYHFSADEKAVIAAALKNGVGLPADMVDEYLYVTGGDLERMVVINYMIDLSRRKNEKRWCCDMVMIPFSGYFENLYNKVELCIVKGVLSCLLKKEMRNDIINSEYLNEYRRQVILQDAFSYKATSDYECQGEQWKEAITITACLLVIILSLITGRVLIKEVVVSTKSL